MALWPLQLASDCIWVWRLHDANWGFLGTLKHSGVLTETLEGALAGMLDVLQVLCGGLVVSWLLAGGTLFGLWMLCGTMQVISQAAQ